MVTIVGLLRSEQELGRAVNALSKGNIDEQLRIVSNDQIRENPIGQELDHGGSSVTVPLASERLSRGHWSRLTGPEGPNAGLATEPRSAKGLRRALEAEGVDSEEAKYLTESVKHGGILLLVDVEQEMRNRVHEVLSNARKIF